MSSLPPALSELLSPKGVTVVSTIADGALQERVLYSLLACTEALKTVDHLELSRYELIDLGHPDLSIWNAAAPEVRTMMVAVRKSADILCELFPAPVEEAKPETEPDLDAAFDSMEFGEVEPIRDKRGVELDQMVEQTGEDKDRHLGPVIGSLAAMLKQDFVLFGQRLRSPQVVADRWFLLGELQEFRDKCTKCLEAIAAAILSAFNRDPVDELIPRYSTEANRSAELRAQLVDLSQDVNRFNEEMRALSGDDLMQRWSALILRMDRFSLGSAYRFIRARDKREIILFRIFLRSWEDDGAAPRALREQLEGFAKFLETMRGINGRQELTNHDTMHLTRAQQALSAGNAAVAVQHLEKVYGRDENLDQWVRARRKKQPEPFAVAPLVAQMLAALKPGF